MDFYGIGVALRATFSMYLHAARRTGRTTALLDAVQDGDTVVFLTQLEASRVRRLAQERGKNIVALVGKPLEETELMHRRPHRPGRVWFDHSFVEQHFALSLERAQHRLAALSSDLNRNADRPEPACSKPLYETTNRFGRV